MAGPADVLLRRRAGDRRHAQQVLRPQARLAGHGRRRRRRGLVVQRQPADRRRGAALLAMLVVGVLGIGALQRGMAPRHAARRPGHLGRRRLAAVAAAAASAAAAAASARAAAAISAAAAPRGTGDDEPLAAHPEAPLARRDRRPARARRRRAGAAGRARAAPASSGTAARSALCVEAGLPLSYLWRERRARERALAMFGKLRVWDTEHNNGVLIYLLLAEHAIEIVADRGLNRHVPADAVAGRLSDGMRAAFRAGPLRAGPGRGHRRGRRAAAAALPAGRRPAQPERTARPALSLRLTTGS